MQFIVNRVKDLQIIPYLRKVLYVTRNNYYHYTNNYEEVIICSRSCGYGGFSLFLWRKCGI